MNLEGLIKLPILILGSVLAFGVLLAVVVGFMFLTASTKTAMPADRAAVYTIDDVQRAFPDAPSDPERETWEITRFIDGEWEILYEYDGIDQPDWSMYVNTMTTLSTSAQDAREGYTIMSGISGLVGPDVETRPADEILTLGERHTCSIYLADDGTEAGNVCLVLDGTRVVHWTVTGIVFTEPGSVDDALGPVLERLKAYDPGDVVRDGS